MANTTAPNMLVFETMSAILSNSQTSVASHPKLVEQMRTLYNNTDLDMFFAKLLRCVQAALVSIQKNANNDRLLDFVAKFAASLTTKTNGSSTSRTLNQDEDEDDEANTSDQFENPLYTRLLDFLMTATCVSTDAVRYRACQLIGKMMSVVSNDHFLDEDVYFKLSDTLLERLKDVNSRVQIQAIAAIYRLQDPSDRECRVTKALQFLMNYDPNWQVRYQALAHLAYSRITLNDIIDRVRDPSPHVRKKALLTLSEKVLIKYISIERRLFILNYALNDTDEAVVEVARRKLLPSWLTFKENDVCKLLAALDVINSTATCELTLERLYADTPVQTIYDDFAPALLVDNKCLVPLDRLNAESALYWRWLCAKCKAMCDGAKSHHDGDTTPTNQPAASNDEQIEGQNCLDKLLPSLTEYCDYFKQVMAKFGSDQMNQMDALQHATASFVLRQLLQMFAYIDFSDVHGKKTLQKLCHELLARRDYDFLFESIMGVYKLLYPSLQQRINQIVELISDIRDPSGALTQRQQTAKTSTHGGSGDAVPMDQDDQAVAAAVSQGDIIDQTIVEDPAANQIDPHEIKMKISELKFKRYKLKDDFDNLYKEFKCVDKQVDMTRLTELRESIRACEDEISSLQAKLDGAPTAASNKPPEQIASVENLSPIKPAQPESSSSTSTTPAAVDTNEVILHCLRLSLCLLQDAELRTLTPQLRSLCDTLILPNIGSVSEEVRALAVRALSLTCILKLELAQRYVHLLLQIMEKDQKDIVIEAFCGIISCIMAFSVNKLITPEDFELNGSREEQSVGLVQHQAAVTKVLSQLASLLDHDDGEVCTRAVEGLCKLYMTGHILSAKLFSKLLIMYFSPLTEGDVRLRSVLSNFLPQFAFMRATNQVCVEESFMITCKHLINAPPDTHLSEIDLMKVVELLWQLTNPRNLILHRRQGGGIARTSNNVCHEHIAQSICTELLKEDNTFKCKTYLKILQMADLTDADYFALKEIERLAEQVHDYIDDRFNKKTAKKFWESIEALLAKKPEYLEEIERKRLAAEEQQKLTQETDAEKTTAANETVSRDNTVTQTSSATRKADDDDASSDDGSPKLLDPMFKRINKKAKVDKSKATKSSSATTTGSKSKSNYITTTTTTTTPATNPTRASVATARATEQPVVFRTPEVPKTPTQRQSGRPKSKTPKADKKVSDDDDDEESNDDNEATVITDTPPLRSTRSSSSRHATPQTATVAETSNKNKAATTTTTQKSKRNGASASPVKAASSKTSPKKSALPMKKTTSKPAKTSHNDEDDEDEDEEEEEKEEEMNSTVRRLSKRLSGVRTNSVAEKPIENATATVRGKSKESRPVASKEKEKEKIPRLSVSRIPIAQLIGSSRSSTSIVSTTAAAAAAAAAATTTTRAKASSSATTSSSVVDHPSNDEPPAKVSRSSQDARVSIRSKTHSMSEARVRVTRSSSGHKTTTRPFK